MTLQHAFLQRNCANVSGRQVLVSGFCILSFTAVSKKFIFEDRIIDLITNTTKFKTDMSISNSICNLCFTELKESISTNIFLHDFHINCINFWINFVDQHSPYQL